jgi:FtsP/CotA-like multicopper oxidase with cupredoxin domain/cytochrome oxidase Cu insertion factor (SCO1/SenC/PrrC family)
MLTAAIIALALATATQTPVQTPAQTSGETPGPDNAPYTKNMGLADKPSMYGLSWFGGDEPLPRPAFEESKTVRSVDGVCKATVHITKQKIRAGEQDLTTSCFDGKYTGPILRMSPGDLLELTVINDGEMNTNIHFHGMQVASADYGDSVFTIIPIGHQYTYRFRIPEYHHPGTYWYHVHSHTTTQRQVMQGIAGTIIIEGELDRWPALKGITEHNCVLHDYQKGLTGEVVQGIQVSWPTYRLVNDQKFPDIAIRPGETKLLRFSAQGPNIFYYLDFGGEKFWVVNTDGNPVNKMEEVSRYPLPPGSRVDVLVQFSKPGRYKLHTSEIRTGPAGDGYSAENLLTMACEGEPVAKPIALPIAAEGPDPLRDLRQVQVDNTRTVVFSETDNDFRIDNRYFDGTRIDQLIKYGTVEKWIVRNSTDELHVFHFHQTDFQVTKINGVPVPFNSHRDNVNIPVRGEIEVIIPFDLPCQIGDFVFHCHILCHEDGGMMQKVRCYDPTKPMPPVREGDGYGAPEDTSHQTVEAANPNAIGGPFALKLGDGKPFTQEQLGDGLSLMTFGYTRCTGACPRTMATFSTVDDILNQEKTRPTLRYVFIAVDPQRDQGQPLLDYAQNAPVPLVALTGTPSELQAMADAFGASYKPQPKKDDGSYTVRHSTDIYLVGPGGRIFKRFALNTDPKVIAAAVQEFAPRVPTKTAAVTEGGAK